MMSKERIFFLADRILSEFERQGVRMKDRKKARSALIRGFEEELKFFESIDREVRNKISRMRRNIPEGSGAWIALYERFFEEEFRKRTRL